MIIQNQVICLVCGDKPYSMHVHDMQHCHCNAVYVDGGLFYLRRGGDRKDWKENSICVSDEATAECITAIELSLELNKNALGIFCAVLRTLRDEGYTLQETEECQKKL